MISIFPLLHKELIEYASTKRIYLLRILYGICIYTVFLISWSPYTSHRYIYQSLGSGYLLLDSIFKANIAAIFIILPIMSSCIITSEKEKRTLSLLLSTPLGPGFILFEKFLGLVFSMFSFLLMSCPVIYMTYLLGGVTNQKIFLSLYSQLLTTLQVAALGLFFSCYCKTSIRAIIATYFCCFALYSILPFYNLFIVNGGIINFFFPPECYFYVKNGVIDISLAIGIFISTLPTWVTISIAFISARYTLIRYPQRINKKSLTTKMSDEFTLIKNDSLRIRLPILWRENSNNYWGFSMLVVMIIVAILGISLIVSKSLTILNLIVLSIYIISLIFVALCVTIKSTTILQREVKQQTWDVLLTTTMSTRSIFFQKALTLTKYTIYLSILPICLHTFHVCAIGNVLDHYTYGKIPMKTRWVYGCTFTILIFSCIQWTMTWLGLIFKNNKRVVFIALIILITWCALPMCIPTFLYEMFGGRYERLHFLTIFSPVTIFSCVIEGQHTNYYYNAYGLMDKAFIIFAIITLFSFLGAYFSGKKQIRVCD
ncbi:ABC transporter permease subunit [Candidatus Uabimicrobium sp. HlEnr_7]|uniref:ABC transporter permease subunit n=1 Tax=Candidatus Uabimicrobium helgolandensis TaxID=3095367 RepID=UPI003557DE6D